MDPRYAKVIANGPSPMLCTSYTEKVSRGIFFGDDPLEKALMVFLLQVIAMSLASHLIYYLLRPLKQPKFVCNVLGGILISPYVTGRKNPLGVKAFPKEEILVPKVWAYFGLTFFLFLVSVKMDLTVIRRTMQNATIIGLSGIVGSLTLVLGTILVLSPSGVQKGFFQCLMAVFLSLTRFPNVAYTFDELNILASDLGQLAMSSSMVSEVFSWLWVAIRLYYRQSHNMHSTAALLSAAAFVGFILFVVRPIIKVLVKKAPDGKPMTEVYVVMILIGALLGALIADMIGALQLGVLFMGLIIPTGSTLGSTLTEKTELVVMEIVIPMFYVIVGAGVDLSSIDGQALGQIFLIVFVGFIGKFAAALGAALFCKLRLQHALLLGLMLNVKGPFDLYTFIKWKTADEVTDKTFAVLVLSQTAITAITAPLIDILYSFYVRVNAAAFKRNMRGLHATPRNAELKILCCLHNEENVPGIVTLLESTNPTSTAPLYVHIMHLRELVGQATPMLVPYGNQLQRVKSKRSQHIMQAFENYLNNTKGTIKVSAYSVIAPFKTMHEYICSLARDELTPLIILPFHETLTEINPSEATSLRNLNIKVQALAPCTVGILVDKTIRQNLSRTTFHYDVGVIFISGADDREALSLAIRMSSHPNVCVNVLQLVIKDLCEDCLDVQERKLDIKLIEEFKRKNANNNRATFQEAVVEDTEQGFEELRALKGQHNLLMVGRQRQGMKSMFDEQMLSWSEHPELGYIGDYISSSDFCSGRTSVLVMQHYSDIKGSSHYSCNDCEGEYLLKGSVC